MNDSGDVGASLLPKAIRGSKLTSQPSANPEPGQWGYRPANDDHKSGEEIAANARPDNANENAKADRFNAINFAKISNDGRTDVASAGNMANSSANKKGCASKLARAWRFQPEILESSFSGV